MSCAKLSMSLSKLCCDADAFFTGATATPAAAGAGSLIAVALLPCSLLFDDLASSTVWDAASVDANALMSFVPNALSGLNVQDLTPSPSPAERGGRKCLSAGN